MSIQLVDQVPTIVQGNMLSSLMKGARTHGLSVNLLPTAGQVWELCRMVGISDALLGPSFTAEWQFLEMTSASITEYPLADLQLLNLVRALLQRPDAMLINGLGSEWMPDVRVAVTTTLRAYLDGSLDPLLYGKGEQQTLEHGPWRSVLWAASRMTLAEALREDELVLTLVSPSNAVLAPKAVAMGATLSASEEHDLGEESSSASARTGEHSSSSRVERRFLAKAERTSVSARRGSGKSSDRSGADAEPQRHSSSGSSSKAAALSAAKLSCSSDQLMGTFARVEHQGGGGSGPAARGSREGRQDGGSGKVGFSADGDATTLRV